MIKKVLKNNMLKKNNGITLITLVITIIVLTILAGVVISTLTSEDRNIISRSKESKEDLEKSQETEILASILIELESKQFSDTEEKIEYIMDSLTLEGISDFEVFEEYISINNNIYFYTDVIPGFSGL